MTDESVRVDFFISYTGKDSNWAQWIAWHLEEAGYTTVIQAWDFQAGGNFVLDMDRATKGAERTIAVLSPDYFASKFTPSEWAAAFRRDPTGEFGLLVPIRVRLCDVEGLLGQIVYIDLVDRDEQAARTMLLARITGQRGKPVSLPAFPGTSHTLAERPAFPGALPAIWNIPYPRNPYFTGREELLIRLATALRTGQTTALSQPQAISGLGGIGKTQLALEYAYRYHRDYQAVFWTQADTRESLVSGFVTIANLLKLPERDEQDQTITIAFVKEWLRTHAQWLLILDNADDLALARDFLPPSVSGHVLLTTHAQATGRFARRLEVDILPTELGALFLLRRAGLLAPDAPLETALPSDVAVAEEITEELGGLPLALDQAGAYIEETGCSLADYQRLFQRRRANLLAERRGLVNDHPLPVATTWSLSFQQVKQANPAAAALLSFCAFLAPDAIPEELLTEGAAELGKPLGPVAADRFQLNTTLEEVRRYSLMRRNTETRTLSMHRLVQAVLKDGMPLRTQRQLAEQAVRAVNATFPDVEVETSIDYVEVESWSRCKRLLPQAQDCRELIDQYGLDFPEAARLLHQTALYLFGHFQIQEAELLYQRALRIRETTLGADHPSTAATQHRLARLYQLQFKYQEAELLYQHALRIRETTLGADHPSTAATLLALARIYRTWTYDKHQEAEPLYQRALRIYETALGDDYFETTTTRDELASLYWEQRKYEQAEPLLKHALAIAEKQLGPEHPDTAANLKNLAELYRAQGKHEQAEPLYQRALAIYEK